MRVVQSLNACGVRPSTRKDQWNAAVPNTGESADGHLVHGVAAAHARGLAISCRVRPRQPPLGIGNVDPIAALTLRGSSSRRSSSSASAVSVTTVIDGTFILSFTSRCRLLRRVRHREHPSAAAATVRRELRRGTRLADLEDKRFVVGRLDGSPTLSLSKRVTSGPTVNVSSSPFSERIVTDREAVRSP